MEAEETGFSSLESNPKEKTLQPTLTQPEKSTTLQDNSLRATTIIKTGRPSILERSFGSSSVKMTNGDLSPTGTVVVSNEDGKSEYNNNTINNNNNNNNNNSNSNSNSSSNNNNTNNNNNNNNSVLTTHDSDDEHAYHNLKFNSVNIKEEPLDTMPPLASPATVVNVVAASSANADKGRELEPSPPATVISLAPAQPYPGTAQLTFAAPAYDIEGNQSYTVQYATVTQAPTGRTGNNGTVYLTTDYITYCDYYPATAATGAGTPTGPGTPATVTTVDGYQTVRSHLLPNGVGNGGGVGGSGGNSASVVATTGSPAGGTSITYTSQANDSSGETTSFLDRYLRQAAAASGVTTTATIATNGGINYKTLPGGLTVDLPSPDSGIGEATITPRPDNTTIAQAILPVSGSTVDHSTTITVTSPVSGAGDTNSNSSTPSTGAGSKASGGRRSWHEYGRNSEVDKVQIPKIFSDVGYKYYLESPISTSQRREDDRITYINKGQFYGITLEYIPDPANPLKSATVKSLVLLVFREEKLHDDEIKAWQFWHSRQHSVKQRILDADTKNSSGIIGPIEEVTHNSIAFYWNPLEGPAKINVAVQCLSTDFSNQKGVKGLPLHLQIDTFDDFREGSLPVHRGYCQIKVFCDKGAERKTRDEERRAAKRKLTATGNGRKKIEEMYHPPCDRSEFYTMSDRTKPPVLFTPNEDLEKQITTGDMSFYSSQHSSGDMNAAGYDSPTHLPSITPPASTAPTSPGIIVKRERSADPLSGSLEMVITQPPAKRPKAYPQDRVLIYAKQENEEIFHPLHLVPPTLVGLALSIQNKYKLDAKNIRHIYKRCSKGITVQMDDDMVKHYCNEDTVLLEVHQVDEQTHDITLVEYNCPTNT